MILLYFWNSLTSVELYTIALIVAAMAVAALAMPRGTGPAETGFLTGELSLDTTENGRSSDVTFTCRPDGAIVIRRTGLPEGLTSSATVALAVTRKGFDINIEERITPADPRRQPILESEIGTPVNCATFVLHGLAEERYHFKYNSDPTSSYCALSFRNTPGLSATRHLA